jgi:hypothetical protein
VLPFSDFHSERKVAESLGIRKPCENNVKKRKVDCFLRIESENDKVCRNVTKTNNDNISIAPFN